MSEDLERRALRVLDAAMEAADGPEARDAELARLCGEDRELLALARELSARVGPTGTAELSGFAHVDALRSLMEEAPLAGRIGPFEVRRWIGAGGMGQVVEGVQGDPPASFAVKVVRPDRITDAALARFRGEAELLARLQHPNVARVFRADVEQTPRGPRPYLAMELVRGEDLRAWLARSPARAARLTMFLEICDGVEHAHRRRVVHGDLKPENVLVDEDGHAKLVDFGIARALEPAGDGPAGGAGAVHGTLPYLAPELADPAARGIVDAGTDVYSLGVLLYEMLAGRRPIELEGGLDESLRRIRAEVPAPLGAHDPSLGRDLEAIAARALAKDPARRYGSVALFAEDVRRALANEPVSARPATALYRAACFARRNRGWVAGATLALVVGVVGFVTTALGRAEADRANAALAAALERAEGEAAKAGAINEAFAGMLRSASPYADGRDVTVAERLGQAEVEIAESLAGQPRALAFLRASIGAAYLTLGLLDEAEPLLRRSLADSADSDPLLRAQALEDLGVLLRERGAFDEAGALLAESLAIHRAELGDADRRTLRSMGNHAQYQVDVGRYDEALAAARRLLEAQEAALGPDDPDLDATLDLVATVHYLRVELDEALAIYRDLVARNLGRHGPDHANSIIPRNNVLVVLQEEGRLDEAEALARELVPAAERAFGERHPEALTARHNLAMVLSRRGRADEAEELLRATHAQLLESAGPDHERTLQVAHTLAATLSRNRKADEALPILRDLLERQTTRYPDPDHPELLLTKTEIAVAYITLRRWKEAEPTLVELVELRERLSGPDHPETAFARQALANVRRQLGR